MRIQIKKRLALIGAISIAQLLCLCCGIFLFDQWLQNSIRTTMTEQVLADNVETARQMTRLIKETKITDIEHDVQSWARLQNIIKDIELPNEGFVCVVSNRDGRLLCHPKLEAHPTLAANGNAGKQMMAKKGMLPSKNPGDDMATKKAMMAKQNQMASQKRMTAKKQMMKSKVSDINTGITGSELEVNGEVQIVAAATIPTMDAKVLVHQKASGIEAAIARISYPVKTIGMTVAATLALLSLLANSGILQLYEDKLTGLNEELESLNGNLEDQVKERTRSLSKTRDSVIFGLAKLAESRDSDTGEHLERIRLYVGCLASHLSHYNATLTPDYIEDLKFASSLHDIGKVGIPDKVLLKSGKLNETERKVMEHHPSIGGDCLRAISEQLGDDDFLELAREIAYAHHERWDGQGYPANLAGEKIPLSARIVALADVYDALRSQRPYKTPMSHAKARAIIVGGRGSHFDPAIVDAFVTCEQQFQEICDIYHDYQETVGCITNLQANLQATANGV